jgi:spermidine/putrescine-binding protein
LQGPDGEIYGAPIAWGDGPFIYDPSRVDEPPGSILDLLEPEWEGRFVMFDAPDQPFYTLAVANGFDEAPLLTPEQLDTVKDQAADLVANAAAFNSGYQDAADRLVAGDIDLAVGGWEAMLTWAAEDGVELEFGFFDEGKGGWWDGLAIPSTADDVDCAYEYIDTILSAEVNAELATNLVSGAVNVDAVDQVGEEAQIYDYSVVEEPDDSNFKSTTPPEDPPEGYASYQDWIDAWAEIKAG